MLSSGCDTEIALTLTTVVTSCIRPAKNRWHPAEGHSVFFLSKHEGQQGKLSFSVIMVFL